MTFYYVLDPMCSWCWGFRPVFRQLLNSLPTEMNVQYVMGGLAADTNEPMPEETRQYIQSQWRAVEEKTGAEFNWDFWQQCQPRRSTYPACRAVIAAGLQQTSAIAKMIDAIQQAYYRQARNPSDADTLIELAGEIGLDHKQFCKDLDGNVVKGQLENNFLLRRKLGANRFPSVMIEIDDRVHCLTTNGIDLNIVLKAMNKILPAPHTPPQ